jgi:sarcosine oxidase subunit gamma
MILFEAMMSMSRSAIRSFMTRMEGASVVDLCWNPVSPLSQALGAGRSGNVEPQPGIRISELTGFSVFHIMARRNKAAETAAAARRHFQLDAPSRPQAVFGTSVTLVWSGPDQVLAVMAGPAAPDLIGSVRSAFDGIASVSEQSDGRCLVRLSGPSVRDLLAKLCSIDVHASAFPVGAAAVTSIDHSTVNLWREAGGADGGSAFSILMSTSFAQSICHAILEAAAEYGAESISEPFDCAPRAQQSARP